MKFKKLLYGYYIYIFVYILALVFLLPQIGLLARFPWQDLIYADFQIFNRWRWFSETLNGSGLIQTAQSPIDFRMNMGENLSISSRVASPFFDVGAWTYAITSSIDIALYFKYFVYSLCSFFGFFALFNIRKFKYEQSKSKVHAKRVIYFTTALVSTLGSPMILHEVGPMVFWYILLTPCWVFILLSAATNGISDLLHRKSLPILLFLTVGASDLFIFFYFPSIYLTIFLLKNRKIHKQLSFILSFVFIELFLLIYNLPYFIYTLSPNYESNRGVWNLAGYWSGFVLPILKYSIILPVFRAPAILFINFIVIGLFIAELKLNWTRNRKYLKLLAYLLLWLLILGSAMHTIPLIRENLPAAFRYHIIVWSFIAFCLLAFILNEEVIFDHKTKSSLKFYSLVFSLVLVLANLSVIYGPITPAGSKRVIDLEFRNWILDGLPSCITTNIDASQYSQIPKQYVFATSVSDAGRNDALTVLIENPSALHGRTFIQWRYANPVSTAQIGSNNGLTRFNTNAFTNNEITNISSYSQDTSARFLLSTSEINTDSFVYLGKCVLPFTLAGHSTPFTSIRTKKLLGNRSLDSTVYIYAIGEVDRTYMDMVNAKFTSFSATFTYSSNKVGMLTLPINYSPELNVVVNGKHVKFIKNKNNLVSIPKNQLSAENIFKVEVYSNSRIVLINFMCFIFLIFYFFYCALYNLARRKL